MRFWNALSGRDIFLLGWKILDASLARVSEVRPEERYGGVRFNAWSLLAGYLLDWSCLF